MECRKLFALVAPVFFSIGSFAQKTGNDVTTHLHQLKPNYPIPYDAPAVDSVKKVLDKVFTYLNEVTPSQLVDRRTNLPIYNYSNIDTNAILKPGEFRLTGYEWGVTYSGMLLVGEVTGDTRYINYTRDRVNFLANTFPYFKALHEKYPNITSPLRQVNPRALDDAGAVAASMIKMLRSGGNAGIRPVVDHLLSYVFTKEFRFPDGTLARNRPQPNTLWLDDLYMSVPAIAQMGKLTGDKKYYDDAVKQVLHFSKRMFNKQNNLYMHGWVQEMKDHPPYYWGRANGWAIMAMVELLDVLPGKHPGRKAILEQFQLHARGIKSYQSGVGFWHQLLDRNDSYLETSATAIFAYCLARAVNKGWIDAKAYAPAAILAWNAVTTKINDRGQVEGTCVGTAMGFEPAFYYYRPISNYAAHGYGPVLLAGGEIITLLKNNIFEKHDSALQLKERLK